MAEVLNPGQPTQRWTDYLSVGNAMVGMRTLQAATETLTTRYFHTDHLGSISVITDENGLVVERLSYDAWGKRRFPNGTDDAAGAITSQSNKGFTGQEELTVAGLVHLNGRVYDPLLARMTSADPTVTDPINPQGWNRYSYVGNDPLAFTDPNGFSWLSNFFHSVVNFFQRNPIARAILQIGVTIALNAILPFAALAAAGGAMIATGLSGGNLGQILKAGAIAGATAFAFNGVGDATNALAHYNPVEGMPAHIQPAFGTDLYAFNVAGHALVGCASSVASGGSCQSGALAAAVGAGAAPFMGGMNGAQRLAASAVLGGVGSVAGGGKFANGAVTGAFGYLFNTMAAGLRWGAYGAAIGASAGGAVGFFTGVAPAAFLVPAGQFLGALAGAIIGDWLTGPDALLSVPNPNGRNGSLEHQANVEDIERDLIDRGLNPRREYPVPTPGGEKSSRFLDIVGRDPTTGRVEEYYQVGRQTQAGNPVAREIRALDDIQRAVGTRPTFRPYN
jgi:RHS repeat-associated protein